MYSVVGRSPEGVSCEAEGGLSDLSVVASWYYWRVDEMIVKMFAVFDSKAEVFGVPFGNSSVGAVLRQFADSVNDRSNPNNLWAKHPGDFQLYEIGAYDDETARFESLPVMRLLGNGAEFVERVRPPEVTSLSVNGGKEEVFS